MPKINLITAGFPCQDISLAGPGDGLAGSRSGLWREVVSAVRLVRPDNLVLENVAALLNRGMGQVCADMAGSGYDIEWDCIPTGINSGHLRNRIVAVAYPVRKRLQVRGDTSKDGENAKSLFEGIGSAFFSQIDPSRYNWENKPVLGRGVHAIPNRVDRLKGLGNAIVPQCVVPIMQAIKEISCHK